MFIEIDEGDVVVCKNSEGRMGRYLVVKTRKRSKGFSGVAIVTSLRSNQDMKKVVRIRGSIYVILTAFHNNLKYQNITETYTFITAKEAMKIHKKCLAMREKQYDNIFGYCQTKPHQRASPNEYTTVYYGGTVRPR